MKLKMDPRRAFIGSASLPLALPCSWLMTLNRIMNTRSAIRVRNLSTMAAEKNGRAVYWMVVCGMKFLRECS